MTSVSFHVASAWLGGFLVPAAYLVGDGYLFLTGSDGCTGGSLAGCAWYTALTALKVLELTARRRAVEGASVGEVARRWRGGAHQASFQLA